MIVYVAESRTADGLAEPVSIAPIVSELSVNRTPSENNKKEALRIGFMNVRSLSSKAL